MFTVCPLSFNNSPFNTVRPFASFSMRWWRTPMTGSAEAGTSMESGFMRAPVVAGTAPHDVPAQIIYGNDLGRNVGYLLRLPVQLPGALILHHLQVAPVIECAHRG